MASGTDFEALVRAGDRPKRAHGGVGGMRVVETEATRESEHTKNTLIGPRQLKKRGVRTNAVLARKLRRRGWKA